MQKLVMVLILLMLTAGDVLQASEQGAQRPKIGLVLSGGGARGGAHVGVLKVLEEHHIPVDAIVGTSMGSLVGGLYAAGYSADEIERILVDTQWTDYIAFNYDRTKIPFRRKEMQRAFPGELKIGIDRNGNFTLSSGLFKRQPMLKFLNEKFRSVADIKNFDDLPIPFRAVATDFSNGEPVTLSSGSLARSVYASLAIPGAFYPIEIDGKTLVDGGMGDNLPLNVMREQFHPDIIFVVDVSTPFKALPEHLSFLDIVNQLSNILVRKNTDRMLETLQDYEKLVVPDLKGISSLDVSAYPRTIVSGENAMKKLDISTYKKYELDEAGYARYRQHFEGYREPKPPVIDRVILENPTYLDDRIILDRLHVRLGAPLDIVRLEHDIDDIYNLMLFDDVTYRIERENSENVLYLSVTPSADINGQLRFAFGFKDDFEGHSDYSFKMEYMMFGLNRLGGEWRTRLEVGIQKLAYTEWYQPLEPLQRFYLRPALFYQDRKVYVSPKAIFAGIIQEGLDQSVEVRAKERGALMGVGMNIGNACQVEGGLVAKKAEPEASFLAVLLDVNNSQAIYYTYEGSQSLTYAFASLKVDTMDHAFFPDRGIYANMQYSHQLPKWGSAEDYSQLYGSINGITSIGRHTLMGRIKSGSTFGGEKLNTAQDFNAYYTLGGLFNLSGLPDNALIGDTMLFGAVGYRYRLSERGFFGALAMPTYIGTTVESGDAWYSEYDEKMKLHTGGSLYIAVDTPLGPFYFGYGMAEGGYTDFYLSLGETF